MSLTVSLNVTRTKQEKKQLALCSYNLLFAWTETLRHNDVACTSQ